MAILVLLLGLLSELLLLLLVLCWADGGDTADARGVSISSFVAIDNSPNTNFGRLIIVWKCITQSNWFE